MKGSRGLLLHHLCAHHNCKPAHLHHAIRKAIDNVARLRQLTLIMPSGHPITVDGLTLLGAEKQPMLPRNGYTVKNYWQVYANIVLKFPKLPCVVTYDDGEVHFVPIELLSIK